jgi:hypothetical protein
VLTAAGEAQAREALDRKMAELDGPVVAPGPATPLTPVKETVAREVLDRKMAELDGSATVPAAPAPPTVVPMAQPLPPSTKQGLERLAELTELYKAGLITPAAYHLERAKIIESLPKR